MRKSIFLALTALAVAGSMTNAAAQAAKKAPPQVAKKQLPPPALPMGPIAFPPFTEKTLNDGAQVLIVENHEQPVVSVNIYIKGAGTTSDTDAKPGVAAMTANLLDAGTKTMTSKQIAETVEGMGANMNTGASADWANVSVTMLKSDLDAVLDVVADILMNPTYPADEVETDRKRTLTDLQVAFSQAPRLAQRQFEIAVFGKHPYGRQLTTTALRSITREDLVAFQQTYYKPSNALIVVAGDVNPAEITPKLEQHLGAWVGKGPARPQFAAAPERTQREIILVNKPGTVQAAYRIGQTIVPATNPDWPALAVAQQILGGSSSAWLFSQLREKKGFTYGAYAGSTQRIDPGYWQMQGDVRNEVADSALDLFLALASDLKTKEVSQQDLDLAKGRLTGSFPLGIETPTQIAGQIAQARMLGQPADQVQTWRQRINAVTAADVQRAAQRYLHPENSLVVISGDASILGPKLARFGTITVVDEQGKPIAASDAAPPKPGPIGIDASSIQPMTLTYVITANGMQIAEMVRTITRETAGSKDIVHSATAATGMMTMSADLKFEAKTFAPLSSSMSQQAGGNEISAMLSVSGGKVSGMMKSPADPDPKMIDAVMPEGTLLAGMDEYAIWLNDFDKNKEMKVNIFSAQTGSVIPVTMKVTGESHQKLAAGEFDVYELEMTTQQGGMKAYVRKAAPHILVKQEFLAQPIVVELKALK